MPPVGDPAFDALLAGNLRFGQMGGLGLVAEVVAALIAV